MLARTYVSDGWMYPTDVDNTTGRPIDAAWAASSLRSYPPAAEQDSTSSRQSHTSSGAGGARAAGARELGVADR